MHLNRDDMEGNWVLNLKPKLSARSDVEIKSIFHGRFGSSKLLNFKPKMHYILRRKLKASKVGLRFLSSDNTPEVTRANTCSQALPAGARSPRGRGQQSSGGKCD